MHQSVQITKVYDDLLIHPTSYFISISCEKITGWVSKDTTGAETGGDEGVQLPISVEVAQLA